MVDCQVLECTAYEMGLPARKADYLPIAKTEHLLTSETKSKVSKNYIHIHSYSNDVYLASAKDLKIVELLC